MFVMSVLVGLGSGSNYVSTPHQSKWITDSSYSIRSTLVSFLDPPPPPFQTHDRPDDQLIPFFPKPMHHSWHRSSPSPQHRSISSELREILACTSWDRCEDFPPADTFQSLKLYP